MVKDQVRPSFCRNILREFLVTAVFLKDCGVHFLKLRSSPCLLHPPYNCNKVGEVKNDRWNVCLCHFKQEQVLCEITFTKNKVSDLPTNLHNSIHPSTVTLPHASEPRLSTYVPYLRAEVTIRSWAKQALVSRDRAELEYWKLCFYRRLHVPLW